MNDVAATRLSAAELEVLRVKARQDSRFINPQDLHTLKGFLPGRRTWTAVILGRRYDSTASLSNAEVRLLALAAEAEPDAATDPRRVAAQSETGVTYPSSRWLTLAAAIPVPFRVLYNYSGPHHYGHYRTGVDHIVVEQGLTVGRLHRPAGASLCQSASRHRFHFDMTAHPEDRPEWREATCRACLRIAAKLAEQNQGSTL